MLNTSLEPTIPISIIKIENGNGIIKSYNIASAINILENIVRLDGAIESEEALDIVKTALWISCNSPKI